MRYDGWNRFAGVATNSDTDFDDAGEVRYTYDGLGQRIAKDFAGGTADDLDYYYNEHWQVLEVRKAGDADPLERYIWDETYADAPVTIERDVNTDGVRDQRLWATYDANYNVTSILTDGGKLVERYAYTPYGTRTVLNGSSNYAGTGADPDGSDWSLDSTGDNYDVKPGYQGLHYDSETGQWQNRRRQLSGSLGVFTQRDPLGYMDGLTLFISRSANPVLYGDWIGEGPLRFWWTGGFEGGPRGGSNMPRGYGGPRLDGYGGVGGGGGYRGPGAGSGYGNAGSGGASGPKSTPSGSGNAPSSGGSTGSSTPSGPRGPSGATPPPPSNPGGGSRPTTGNPVPPTRTPQQGPSKMPDGRPVPGNSPEYPIPKSPGKFPVVPDPAAGNSPHTRIGIKNTKNSDHWYRQGFEFDEFGVFKGRYDITDHGLPNHFSPHFHPYSPSTGTGGGYGPGQAIPSP